MSQPLEVLHKQVDELFENEKFQEIIDLLTDEVLEEYGNAELYMWRGMALDEVQQYDEAINDYTEAIRLKPNNPEAFYNRGIAWRNKNEYDKAINDYTEAIRLEPNNPSAFNNRGIVWRYKNEYDKAIDDYTEAIRLNPNYSEAFNNRGIAWRNKNEYDKAIDDYTEAIRLNPNNPEAFNNRGAAWRNKNEYAKAIDDYTETIRLKPNYPEAFNNRGIAWADKLEYDKAIEDYNEAIRLKPNYPEAFTNRGNAWSDKQENDKAIDDYTEAIRLNPRNADAYYNLGLTLKLLGRDFKKGIAAFEEYLKLTPIKDDIWAKRAKEFIVELNEMLGSEDLKMIADLIAEIRKLLLITDGCVTHYTRLSTASVLILDNTSKFRISEGAFLNDTSEGSELFKFLDYQFSVQAEDLNEKNFTPKPFIGSFVAQERCNDLNLWRFYGKEENEEAKGAAITIRMKDLIDAIQSSLSNGKNNTNITDEEDINFYRIAYWNHQQDERCFQIPNHPENETRLNELMRQLKTVVDEYNPEDKATLEKYLNNIAFLFKSDSYKNENELRLIVKGIGSPKYVDKKDTPPRVYIELVNIRPFIEQITLGPKVDKPEEWASAFHYSYDDETDDTKKPKKIVISRLPYK